MRKLSSAVVSRGSHVQNVPHALAPQSGPGDEADGAERDRRLGPGAGERVAHVGGAHEVADGPDEAGGGADVHAVPAGHVEVEDLLDDPHARLDGRLQEDEQDLAHEDDRGRDEQRVEQTVERAGTRGCHARWHSRTHPTTSQ